jgi:hypothetical protein
MKTVETERRKGKDSKLNKTKNLTERRKGKDSK